MIMLVLGAGVLPGAITTSAVAAPDDGTFTTLRGFTPTGAKVRVEPKEYAASRVDLAALRGELPTGDASSVVSVPDPSGGLQTFRVRRTQVMESELAGAHPEIATYAGRGVDDPQASIALDLTPMGFHAFVRAPGNGRDWYVDPAYNRRGTTAHLSYYGKDLPRPEQRRKEGEVSTLRDTVTAAQQAATDAGQPVTRRYFRLALTSDPSYAAYFGTENVLAEKVTLINRVNEIYNDDLAVELRLVDGTESLNLDTDAKATGANGPCGSAPCFAPPTSSADGELEYCDVSTLGKNRTVLGQLIGASNYDVGHIALGVNGGGIAYLGVIGGDFQGYKGGGCTGLPEPKGDFFAIDYVAHEIGHQFGGNHTFNGALGACGGNISDASVEPGSGSSVMAYAGICGQDDLQPHTDPYFSHLTVDEAHAVMDAAPRNNVEVQTVSLSGFGDVGDSFTLEYDGRTSEPIVFGTNYNPVGLKLAIEAITDQPVSIAQWGYDQYNSYTVNYVPPVVPDKTGFQVIFNAVPSIEGEGSDLPTMDVTDATGVTGFVGETSRGGPSQNAGVAVESDNSNPTVTAPEDRTVPKRTPFALTGSGTDADGEPLVYLWEQTNFGEGTQLADNTKTYGPLFRVFGDDAVVTEEDSLKSPSPGENIADGSPTRVFPDMAQVLAGNTNADTGDCPAPTTAVNQPLSDPLLDCYSEFLPDTDYLGSLGTDARQMQFRLTARDMNPAGGGLSYDDVALTVDPDAGPFQVTSQVAAGTTVAGGSAVPVTWAVNNTQRLAPSVKISLSTDGGATFGTVLAAGTPNDGAETLTMPNVAAADVRLKIEAVDNYFFDVNDASFALTATPATTPTPTPTPTPGPPAPGVPDTTITSGPADGSVVLSKEQSFAYASTVAPATYVCHVDGDTVPCAVDGLERHYPAGTHEFSVAAVNAAGVADATPATRTFTVPRNDGALVQKGSWKRVTKSAAYGGHVVTSRDRGDQLVTRIQKATAVTLIVSTRRNAGTVTVFIGKKRVKTFNLKGKNRVNRLRTVALDKPRSGKVRIVVGKDKPVRIEGVAVVTEP
ncbi:reprolysin-like metallopeptidase [Nocardioides sp. P5_C9_2]